MNVVFEMKPNRRSLRGARVAFTGRLASMTRREAQELIRRAGATPTSSISRRTSHLVIGMHGWPLKDDGAVSLKLQQAEKLQSRSTPIQIVSELELLDLLGRREREPDVRKGYTLEQVAQLVGAEQETIERWETMGLVRSQDGSYDFQDIVSLQTIASLVKQGVDPADIQRSLESLSQFIPDTDRPLAQLRVVASASGELLAQVGETMIAPDGQQMLEFELPTTAEEHSGPYQPGERPAAAPTSAEAAFERAVWLEEEERFEDSADVYRQAIALQPGRAEAYFNLGNVLRMLGYVEAAEELYRLAVALDPNDELAWYNLADVLEEDDQLDEAVDSLRRAIKLCPTFADSHFNLASCLDQLGRHADATPYWQSYLQLDPMSEWAEIARKRLR